MAISVFRGSGRKVQEDRSVLFQAQLLGPKSMAMANAYAGALADVIPGMFAGVAQSPTLARFASEEEEKGYKEAQRIKPKQLDQAQLLKLSAESLEKRRKLQMKHEELLLHWRSQYGAAYDARGARRDAFLEALRKASNAARPLLIEPKETGLRVSAIEPKEMEELDTSELEPASPYVDVQRGALADAKRVHGAYEYGAVQPRHVVRESIYRAAALSAVKFDSTGRIGFVVLPLYNAATWPAPTE